MKRIRHQLEWRRLTVLLAFGGAIAARGQARYEQEVEPQMLRFRVTSASVGAYAEVERQDVSYRGGFSSTMDRLFVGPLIGLNVEGSIYHPNLLEYSLSSDWAWGWTEITETPSHGKSTERSDFDRIGNFTANITLLANKPYRAQLYASSTHSFREYDFFNRAEVDTLRFGGTAGYSEGPVPFTVSMVHYEEDASGFGYDTSLRQNTLNLEAHNDRETGNSTLTYAFNDYDRSVSTVGGSGSEQTIGLADRETFGTKTLEWRNSASYSNRELNGEPNDASPNDSFTAESHLEIHHRRNLLSTYNAHYLRDEANDVTSDRTGADANVEHKLYQSLTSALRFQVDDYSSTRLKNDFDTTQYIGQWSEAYTKKIGKSSRLSISGSLAYSHTDQDSSGIVPVIGEAHTFVGGPLIDSFYLNLLNVEPGSIDLFSPDRTIRYLRNSDYTIIVAGNRTIIQLVQPSPSGLTATTPVVADYQAMSQGSGEIDGQMGEVQIRLDFLDGMWGVYARFSDLQNDASEGLIVEDSTDAAFGADFSKNWFRAGVEYEMHDATFSSYNTLRAYQSATISPDDMSSIGLTLSEGTTDYDTVNRTENYFSAILRYHQMITRSWTFDLDSGLYERWGSDVDQMLAAVRPSISYNVGKLSMKLSYDFEYRTSESDEEREKHLVTLRARRSF